MKKRCMLIVLCVNFLILGACNTVFASPINLSLHPHDWTRDTGYPNQGPATITQTEDGYLRGTKTTGTGGSPSALDAQTEATYNFQNATLRYQWLVNGQGSYSAILSGTKSDIPQTYHYDDNSWLSTHHSWSGSEVIESNTWLYTEVKFNETGYDYTVSYSGYGGNDFLFGTRAYNNGSTTWNNLADAHFWFRLVDNYRPNVYFEVAEAYITPVPIPATILLFGSGVAALVGSRIRRKKASS